jgi:tetratricopeptide (TPR) repeat protein
MENLPGIGQPLQSEADAFVPQVLNQETPNLMLDVAGHSPAHLYELGLTTAAMGYHSAAIEALRACTESAPDHAAAGRNLAELLRLAGKDAEAKASEAAARASSGAGKWQAATGERVLARLEKTDSKLRETLDVLRLAGKPPEEGMTVLRDRLVADPLNVPAMRLLAQLEKLSGDEITSLRLLERALDLCPQYIAAREDYAALLIERQAHAAAATQTAHLIAHAPDNAHYRNMHAWAMVNTGDGDSAIEILTELLRENPRQAKAWQMYAQALHFMGRTEESVQAYRRCLELQPGLGEAYWGLADLKGNFITEADIAAMRKQLSSNDALEPEGRRRMLYAIGQSLERAGDYQASFSAYAEGARVAQGAGVKRRGHGQPNSTDDEDANGSDPGERVRRAKAVFSRKNFLTRLRQAPADALCDTPIFIVGLPRAGSTLTEQILASHSQVEGTRELSLIGDIARDLGHSRMLVKENAYPECVLDLSRDQLAALGARYIERSRSYRKIGRPYFIDKRPWNWLEVGLIHLILPQAKIIDIRREPMAACFAMFKQLLPNFAFDLDGLGRYYNKYVHLMEHWQDVLPGRVHFVQYERLVADTETEIRRMLDYCGLPFEEICLRFWETDRIVSTPSAQQVRRPIYRNALEQWRNFEPWLGPLKEALDQPVRA